MSEMRRKVIAAMSTMLILLTLAHVKSVYSSDQMYIEAFMLRVDEHGNLNVTLAFAGAGINIPGVNSSAPYYNGCFAAILIGGNFSMVFKPPEASVPSIYDIAILVTVFNTSIEEDKILERSDQIRDEFKSFLEANAMPRIYTNQTDDYFIVVYATSYQFSRFKSKFESILPTDMGGFVNLYNSSMYIGPRSVLALGVTKILISLPMQVSEYSQPILEKGIPFTAAITIVPKYFNFTYMPSEYTLSSREVFNVDRIESSSKASISMAILGVPPQPKAEVIEYGPEDCVLSNNTVMRVFPPGVSIDDMYVKFKFPMDIPDLIVEIEAPSSCEVGETLNVTVTLRNIGRSDAYNVTATILFNEEVIETKFFKVIEKGYTRTLSTIMSPNLTEDDVKLQDTRPIKVEVTFKNRYNATVSVTASKNIKFYVVPRLEVIKHELSRVSVYEGGIIELILTVKNKGTGTAYRVSIDVNCTNLSIVEDLSEVISISPGESIEIRVKLKALSAGKASINGVSIMYYDYSGTSYQTECPMYLEVTVSEKPAETSEFPIDPLTAVVAIIIIALMLIVAFRGRKK